MGSPGPSKNRCRSHLAPFRPSTFRQHGAPDLLFRDLTDWSVVEANGFPDYRYNDREIIRAFAAGQHEAHDWSGRNKGRMPHTSLREIHKSRFDNAGRVCDLFTKAFQTPH